MKILLLWSCVVYKKEFGENGRLARTWSQTGAGSMKADQYRPV